MKNLTRCQHAQEEFDAVVSCPVHYQVHLCTGSDRCILTEDGTCCYTGRSFNGVEKTDVFSMDGSSDFSSNTIALTLSHGGTTCKPGPVTDSMDLDSFIASVHQGLAYVEGEKDMTLEDESLTDSMMLLLTRIHAIMSYNIKIIRKANVTRCNVWVESTIQVLRRLQGKSLIPNMPSKSEVKAIVHEALLSLEPPKKVWWATKSCITKQWRK